MEKNDDLKPTDWTDHVTRRQFVFKCSFINTFFSVSTNAARSHGSLIRYPVFKLRYIRPKHEDRSVKNTRQTVVTEQRYKLHGFMINSWLIYGTYHHFLICHRPLKRPKKKTKNPWTACVNIRASRFSVSFWNASVSRSRRVDWSIDRGRSSTRAVETICKSRSK